MLDESSKVSQLNDKGDVDNTQNTTAITTRATVDSEGNMKSAYVMSTLYDNSIPPIFAKDAYNERSKHLLRNIYIMVANQSGDAFILKDCKIDVSGSKYIGIQQDMFSITVKNINLQSFAAAINTGYIYVRVVVDERVIFAGSIKNINTARENIVERTMTLNCLMKVTELLSDIVSPITVNSAMNVWHVLNMIDPYMVVEIPEALRELKFDTIYTFTGQKKTVVDDIIKVLNNQLNRIDMRELPWLEYEFRQDGTLSLFGPSDHVEVLNMQPYTGLIGPPRVMDTEVQFDSIYKYKLTPGRVVKLDNSLFATTGTNSAFIYAFDENGLYVITEVKYQFSNYPWKFTCSCKARPLSKYQNFIVK